MTRFFCCCLPVRLGVFVLSFLQLLLGGAEAGLIWHSISQPGQVEGAQRIAFMVLGGVCSLLALAAFLGLCGSVTRSRTLVTIYATVLYILLALTLGSGVWFAYTLFTDRGDSWMSSCRAEGQNIKDAQLKSIELNSGGFDKALDGICDALLKTFRIVYIVVLVIVFLVQLYCAHIVRNYAEQLSEEEASRHNAKAKVYISQPQPQMVHAVPIHHGGYNQSDYYGGSHSRHGSTEKMLSHSERMV